MPKKISLIKNFNKLLLSVNTGIESFFNNIKILLNSKKKTKSNLTSIDKKILISTGSIIILVFSYFLIPTFYDKNLLKTNLTNQILDKYNLKVNFNGSLKYGLFPKPHYLIKDLNIIHNDESLVKVIRTKVYISIKNFFIFDNLKIKSLNFKQAEFDLNSTNFDFFKKTLNSIKSRDDIIFKKSNLFYKDQYKDIIFLAKLDDLFFSYTDELEQKLEAKLKIFNIPLDIEVINNLEKNILYTNIKSHKLRIHLENNINYNQEENLVGLLDFKIINKLKTFNYKINKDSLIFSNDENNIKGKLDFKPFFISSDLNFSQIDIIKLFEDNSIFLNLLNAEILNNQSINAQINISLDKISNINYLNNIFLKTNFEEGNIFIKDSNLNWKNSILIKLDDVQLISENSNFLLVGALNLDFKDIDDFYRQYQIKKIYRKKIKKIRLDFLLDIKKKEIEINDLRIDGSTNKKINSFIDNLNSKKENIFNKIIFKNSIKEFFSVIYDG